MDGSAGWADAAVIIPYILYRFYGNQDVLSDQYESMVKWLGFLENRARKTRLINRLRPNPHRQYIIDTGYHWGEWLEPGHAMPVDALRNVFLPDAEVATAYYAYSAGLLSEIAEVLGKNDAAARYRAVRIGIGGDKVRSSTDGIKGDLQFAVDKGAIKAGNDVFDLARRFREHKPGGSQLVQQRLLTDRKHASARRTGQQIVDRDIRRIDHLVHRRGQPQPGQLGGVHLARFRGLVGDEHHSTTGLA